MGKKKPLYQVVYTDLVNKINSDYYTVDSKLPSEKELGEEYNVSRITIKTAIQQLVEEGYVTRTAGKGSFILKKPQQSINNSKSKMIGLVISGFGDNFGKILLTSIEKIASENSYSLIIKITNENQDTEVKHLKKLVDIGVDGIIVLPVQGEYYNPYLLQLVINDFPIVIIDRKLEGLPYLFIGSDNFSATKNAISYLLQKNHLNISVVMNSSLHNSSINDRLAGVKEGFVSNNIVYDEKIWITNINSSYTHTSNSPEVLEDITNIIHHIQQHPSITCFLTFDYHCAELIYEATTKLNKSIPNDFSLLTFDTPSSIIYTVNFSHIKQEEQKIGETAVMTLLRKLNGTALQSNTYLFPTQIIENGSIRSL